MPEESDNWTQMTLASKVIYLGKISGALSAIGALVWGIYLLCSNMFASPALAIESESARFTLPDDIEVSLPKLLDSESDANAILQVSKFYEQIKITNQSDKTVSDVAILFVGSALVESITDRGEGSIQIAEGRFEIGQLKVEEAISLRIWSSFSHFDSTICVYEGGRQTVREPNIGFPGDLLTKYLLVLGMVLILKLAVESATELQQSAAYHKFRASDSRDGNSADST